MRVSRRRSRVKGYGKARRRAAMGGDSSGSLDDPNCEEMKAEEREVNRSLWTRTST
jgi:hypothetical protein